ncbi:MAG TPA: hypothetical protein VFG50_09440 [Rhodothermales bacterium]|nr:hypothetical protein [Rhodothermales bacterium]
MYPLPVSVETYGRPFVDGIDVMGYIGGKHPVLSRELVIVCADLDAMGPVGVAPATDLEQRGVAASALLEVARVQSRSAQAFSTPERTILFAVWPGGRLDHAGFRAYLNRPVWPLDATRAVIYIGLRKSDSARLRGVLSSHGVDLYAVSPADSLVQDQAVMSAPVPNPTASAPAGAQAEGGDDLSRAMDQASLAAERMAREANDLLVSLAASPVPLPSEPSGRPPSRVRVDGH